MICGRKKMGEYDMLQCYRSKGHGGECVYSIVNKDATIDRLEAEKAQKQLVIDDCKRNLKEQDAAIARLTRELEEARGMCDLYVDEFHRIIAIADNSEIKGLCERAVFGIKQRIPLIEQRDNLEAENAALRGEVERLGKENEQLNLGWNEMFEWMHAIVKGEKMENGDYPHLGVCSRSRNCPTYDCSVCSPKPYRAMKNSAEQAEAELAAERGKVEERLYPCADCGKLRTKDEGGTTFTVCDECWDKRMK